jgi:hypothetical protein
LNTADKFIIRKSILELAKRGAPRSNSIDDEIRQSHRHQQHPHRGGKEEIGDGGYEGRKNDNLWDYITALGAQLSRPPYDPYREIVNLDTPIGRRKVNGLVMNMPLLIYSDDDNNGKEDERGELHEGPKEALHIALNRLAESGIALGFVSRAPSPNRKYFLFQKVDGTRRRTSPSEHYDHGYDDNSDGLVLEYEGKDSVTALESIRREFDGPILVRVDEDFLSYVDLLLSAGADGLLVDTSKILTKASGSGSSISRYKDKHAIKVIRDARSAIDAYYYKRKTSDGACLVVAGDVNNSGSIVKAAALGADVIGYSTSLLIANAELYSGNPFDVSAVAERIARHILATRGEIKGVAGALGYSNFHNLSPSDLRTSSIEASLQGNIALEGPSKRYKQIVEEILDDLIREEEKGLIIEEEEKKKLLLRLMVDG